MKPVLRSVSMNANGKEDKHMQANDGHFPAPAPWMRVRFIQKPFSGQDLAIRNRMALEKNLGAVTK